VAAGNLTAAPPGDGAHPPTVTGTKVRYPDGMDPELRGAVRTLAHASRGIERAVAPLTLPQYRILALVADAPERASRLAQRVDVTKASLTGVLDALEARGLLQRTEVHGDRRGVTLVLTPAGTDALAVADAATCAWLASVLALADRPRDVTAALADLGQALVAHRRAKAEA
jgi:DNA-binding MarR family transcriptional regulator